MKIRSMTGFGRAESNREGRKYTVEIKAVNHRFLEMNVKLPKLLSVFEASVRNIVKEQIGRGKVDVFISYEDQGGVQGHVTYNSELAREYMKCLETLGQDFPLIRNDVSVMALSRCPDVLSVQEMGPDEDEILKELEETVRAAVASLIEARETEGETLRKDLLEKLKDMHRSVSVIEERAPKIQEEYKARLREKVQELLGEREMEEGRLIAEVVIYADKVAVDEEIVRLKSHIDSMEQVLTDGGNCGRKLDFIAQEMNREANTTLSKANDLTISDVAIDLKTGIEKIREQIQNIE